MSVRVGAVRSFDEVTGEGDNRRLSAKYNEQHKECAACHRTLVDRTEKSVWVCHNPACQAGSGTTCHIRCMFERIRDEHDGGAVAVCPNNKCNKRLNEVDREKIHFIFTADLKEDYERQVVESNSLMFANVRLSDTVSRLEAENGTLRHRVVQLEEENSTLRNRVSELEHENEALKDRVNKLTHENGTLRNRIHMLEKENASLKALVQDLRHENAMLKARVHTLEREVRFLQEGHAETNMVIAQMKKTIDQLILGAHT